MGGSVVYDRWRQCVPTSNTCFLGLARVHIPEHILIVWVVFAQLVAECPDTLQWAAPSPPLKIASSHRGSEPPSSTWFLGPTQVHNLNDISVGSAVCAVLTIVTDRPADRPRCSVCNNRLHLCTVQPNNFYSAVTWVELLQGWTCSHCS